MADLGRVEEDGPLGEGASTASGRPKRAVTTRTAQAEKEKEKEREAELAKNAANTTPNKKVVKPDGAEASTEKEKDKVGKQRRKKDTGEKRKSKAPTASTAPNVESPQKLDRPQDVVMHDVGAIKAIEGSPSAGDSKQQLPADFEPGRDDALGRSSGMVGEGLNRPRGAHAGQGQRQLASSYWSVPEQQDFTKFIAYFGTDFAAIAAHMGTKTTTMVRPYSFHFSILHD